MDLSVRMDRGCHISLVFREMWDTTGLYLQLSTRLDAFDDNGFNRDRLVRLVL